MRYMIQTQQVEIYGIDIGKSLFHVADLGPAGDVQLRTRLRRLALLHFFSNAPVAVVAMKACPGSQWLARKLQSYGHTVRIIPAQFVKPYVKSNKNDTVDAEAIAEAGGRPTMRFVKVKRIDQIDLQALHRARDMMVSQRTALISQMRGLLLEHGIALRAGAGAFKLDLVGVMDDESNELTPAMRGLLATLASIWPSLKHASRRYPTRSRRRPIVTTWRDGL